MPQAVARDVLIPRLPEFLAAHPDLEIELSSTDRRVDLVQEGFDCVLVERNASAAITTRSSASIVGSRTYAYWSVANEGRRLTAFAANIDARKSDLIEYPIAIVTEHTLHRLFQRLNTIDYRTVLQELNRGIDRLFWLQLDLLHGKISPVLVPTPTGALVFRHAGAEEEEAPFVAVTWLSDDRMRESQFKLRAVQEAREEQGVAVAVEEGWLVISRERIARMENISGANDRQLLAVFAASWPARSGGGRGRF